MEIEAVIKIYDFLGNLDIPGFIALCILLSVSILAIFIPLKEKKITTSKFITIIVCLINVALIALYVQAKKKIPLLHTANFIKQDLIAGNFKQKSFNNISLPNYIADSARKTKLLNDIIDEFPDEFLLVIVNDQAINTLDRKAVALIDTKAIEKIDKQIDEKANRTSHLLITFMKANNLNVINMNDYVNGKFSAASLQSLDNDGWLTGQPFAKSLIGRNDLQPIYDGSHSIIGFTVPKAPKN